MILPIWIMLLPLGIVLGVPAYIYFRNSMTKRPKSEAVFSRRRVVRLTTINLLLNSLATVYFLCLFYFIFQEIYVNNFFLTLTVLAAIFAIFSTFYGNGMYITSIVLEAYTLHQIRRLPQFKTQFIATHLFHGPISHILIYSGWLVFFLLMAILDLFRIGSTYAILPILLGGGVTGIAYAIAQIYNGSALYQLIVGLFSLSAITTILVTGQFNLNYHPITLFFLATITTFNLSLLTNLALRK